MHGRPRLSLPLLSVLVALVIALVLGGLLWLRDRPVPVTAPDGAADPACARLASRLPSQVLDRGRRRTSSDSPAVAAWGDPAIIWRCGVAAPAPTPQTCLDVDGVDWIVTQLDDGSSFTTYGREPAVQVLVPNDYFPGTFALPPLSRVVRGVPQGSHRCTGPSGS